MYIPTILAILYSTPLNSLAKKKKKNETKQKKTNQVRARIRLRILRWHERLSAEVNKNINLGYSQLYLVSVLELGLGFI